MNKNVPVRREDTFDLTTEEGILNAMEALRNFHMKTLLMPWYPTYWLLKRGYDYITQRELDTLEAQKKTAIDLIEAGKNRI